MEDTEEKSHIHGLCYAYYPNAYSKLSTLLLIQQSVKHNPGRSGKEG